MSRLTLRRRSAVPSDVVQPRGTAVVSTRGAAVIAVVAGLVGYAAFPTVGLWSAALLSVALLNVAALGRSARAGALVGLLYGLAFFVPLLRWTGIYVGAVPWLALAVTESLYLAAMGAALPTMLRLRGSWFWVSCLWVLQEAVRDRWPFGGFSWARLAFSQATSPLRWFAMLGGAPLVSFVTALGGVALGSAIVWATTSRERSRAWWGRLGLRLIATMAGGLVALAIPSFARPTPTGPNGQAPTTATIAVIQGSTPDRGLEFNARRRQVLDNHVQQTLDLAADIHSGKVAQPEIVFWPENASDIDPLDNADAGSEIQAAADAVGVPILVGAVLDGPGADHISNVGLLWEPHGQSQAAGPVERYTKRHPVPFAEYIPFRSIARAISSKVDLVQRDMVAGTGNGLMSDGPFPFGDVICFEVAYDELVRSSVTAGAQILVIQTNNATFGHTAETYQQLAMSQLRAVETQRSVVQVSTTGVSAVIDSTGHIVDRSGALFTPSRLVDEIQLNSAETLATRIGAWPEYLASLAALLAIALNLAAWLRRRRETTDAAPEDDEIPASAPR